jgi:hypothetical protein
VGIHRPRFDLQGGGDFDIRVTPNDSPGNFFFAFRQQGPMFFPFRLILRQGCEGRVKRLDRKSLQVADPGHVPAELQAHDSQKKTNQHTKEELTRVHDQFLSDGRLPIGLCPFHVK